MCPSAAVPMRCKLMRAGHLWLHHPVAKSGCPQGRSINEERFGPRSSILALTCTIKRIMHCYRLCANWMIR